MKQTDGGIGEEYKSSASRIPTMDYERMRGFRHLEADSTDRPLTLSRFVRYTFLLSLVFLLAFLVSIILCMIPVINIVGAILLIVSWISFIVCVIVFFVSGIILMASKLMS